MRLIPLDQEIAEAKRRSVMFRVQWTVTAPLRRFNIWRLRRRVRHQINNIS